MASANVANLVMIRASRRKKLAMLAALGAVPADMLRLIAGRGLVLAAAGIAAGSFGAFVLSGFVESLLFQPDRSASGAHIGMNLSRRADMIGAI